MRKIKWQTPVCITAAVIFLALLWLVFHGITFHLDKDVSALEIIRGEDTNEQRNALNVSIEGDYTFRLWRSDIFSGKLQIEGYDLTRNDVYMLEVGRDYDILCYRKYENSKLSSYVFGDITAGFKFNSFEIRVNDENGAIDTGNPEHTISFE